MKLNPISLSRSFFPRAPKISIYEVVFPLVKVDKKGNVIESLGSCFAIAGGGLYLTAAHIFKPFLDINTELRKYPEQRSKLYYDLNEYRCAIVKQISAGNGNLRWELKTIHSLCFSCDQDLVFLLVEDEDFEACSPRLPIKENPMTGDRIKIVGFSKEYNFSKPNAKGSKDLFMALVESEGVIQQLFEEKRDSVMCWFPCLQTSAQMDSGHSGGPAILWPDLAVCGINSVSPDDGYSMVAWLGKSLDSPIGLTGYSLSIEGKSHNLEDMTLRDLSQHGVVNIV